MNYRSLSRTSGDGAEPPPRSSFSRPTRYKTTLKIANGTRPEPPGIVSGKERVARRRPFVRRILQVLEPRHDGKDRDQNTGDRAAGNITGRHQYAVRFIGLSNDLVIGQVLARQVSS